MGLFDIRKMLVNIHLFVWIAFITLAAGKADLVNVALHKQTLQYHGQYSRYSSGLAVDGNRNQHFHNGGSCTHTSVNPVRKPYWEVDLGASYWIEFIRIYNRGDCCGSRLQQVIITTSRDHVTYKSYTYHHEQVGSIEDIYPDNPWTVGRWVKIALNYVTALTLCEVEVMAKSSIPRVRFQTIPSSRASGSIIYSYKTVDVFGCLSECRKNKDCYSMEVERGPAVNTSVRCTLFDSAEYSSSVTEYVQFIKVTL